MSDPAHPAGNGERKKFREMMAGELATVWARVLVFALPFLISAAVWAGATIIELQAEKIAAALTGLDDSVREIRGELKALREADMRLTAADAELRLQAQRNADAIDMLKQREKR